LVEEAVEAKELVLVVFVPVAFTHTRLVAVAFDPDALVKERFVVD